MSSSRSFPLLRFPLRFRKLDANSLMMYNKHPECSSQLSLALEIRRGARPCRVAKSGKNPSQRTSKYIAKVNTENSKLFNKEQLGVPTNPELMSTTKTINSLIKNSIVF